MKKIQIVADATCDLGEKYFLDNGVKPILHGISYGDKEIFDTFGKSLSTKEIYYMLRNGTMFSTLQGRMDEMYSVFEEAVSNGYDVLYVCFTSGLSGTYNTACMVARDVMNKLGGKIEIFDTKCAALGHGILVKRAYELSQTMDDISEIAKILDEEKDYIHHYAIIDNLDHLRRGGRISSTSALVGTVVGIKPIVAVTSEGKLEPFTKVRGMNNGVKFFIEKINEHADETSEIYISHADNEALSEKIEASIKENTKVTKVYSEYLGSIIGSHVGPGAIVVCFKAKNKR